MNGVVEIVVSSEELQRKLGWVFETEPVPETVVLYVRRKDGRVSGWVYYLEGEYTRQDYNNAAPVGELRDYGVDEEVLQEILERCDHWVAFQDEDEEV